jgi:hypothetical protein
MRPGLAKTQDAPGISTRTPKLVLFLPLLMPHSMTKSRTGLPQRESKPQVSFSGSKQLTSTITLPVEPSMMNLNLETMVSAMVTALKEDVMNVLAVMKETNSTSLNSAAHSLDGPKQHASASSSMKVKEMPTPLIRTLMAQWTSDFSRSTISTGMLALVATLLAAQKLTLLAQTQFTAGVVTPSDSGQLARNVEPATDL